MITTFTITKPYYQTSRPSTAKTHNLGISQENAHNLPAKYTIMKFESKNSTEARK